MYLVRNGSERVVTSTREHLFDLRQLENYVFLDEFGKDQGVNGMQLLFWVPLLTVSYSCTALVVQLNQSIIQSF